MGRKQGKQPDVYIACAKIAQRKYTPTLHCACQEPLNHTIDEKIAPVLVGGCIALNGASDHHGNRCFTEIGKQSAGYKAVATDC